MLLMLEKVRVQQKTQSHSFFLPFLLLISEYRSINIKILKIDEILYIIQYDTNLFQVL